MAGALEAGYSGRQPLKQDLGVRRHLGSMLALVVALLGFGACDGFLSGSLSMPRASLVGCVGDQQVWTCGHKSEVALFGFRETDWTTRAVTCCVARHYRPRWRVLA